MEPQFNEDENEGKGGELSFIENDKKLPRKRQSEVEFTSTQVKKLFSQEEVDRIMEEQRTRIEEDITRIKEETQRIALISNMNTFISFNLASSTLSSYSSFFGKNMIEVQRTRLNGVLKRAGMNSDILLPPLSEQEWDVFCKQITASQNDNESERKGVHPVVFDVVKAILETIPSPHNYRAVYEQLATDEDEIDKVPDISFVMADSQSRTLSSIVMPFEIKKKGNANRAINQSLGFLMTKLRNQLQIEPFAYGSDLKVFGLCFGTDGYNLSVGCILIKDCKVSVYCTPEVEVAEENEEAEDEEEDKLPFWTTVDRKKPATETLGIRLLRTLLSLPLAQLGHSFAHKKLLGECDGNSLTFELDSLIGKGGFAAAFEASVQVPGSERKEKVVIKMPFSTVTRQARIRSSPVDQLKRECEILRSLNKKIPFSATAGGIPPSSSYSAAQLVHSGSEVGHFPSLLFDNWECATDQMYIPMTPIGISLARYASIIGRHDRIRITATLRAHLTESLTLAHSLGYCHCDLKPDNVVFSPEKNEFIIIDWGLGCATGSNFHGFQGGVDYFHDDIVKLLKVTNSDEESIPSIPYEPEYDMASALYVVYAFKLGQKNLSVPWQNKIGKSLIKCRAKKVNGMK